VVDLFKASHRHARISARKARLSADLVRGLPVNQALEALEYTPRRAARLIEKVIKSALANAQQDEGVDLNRLVVAEARIDEGPLLGGRPRWRPAARGRSAPIRKRTSHIIIGLGAPLEPVLAEALKSTPEQPAPETPDAPASTNES